MEEMIMAKKKDSQKKMENTAKIKKKTGAGAVFGSILFFIFTFLFTAMLLLSTAFHMMLEQNSVSVAVSQMDLSRAEVTDDGKTQNLGRWMYDWYLFDAPNLTPEYAEAAMAHPEVNAWICDNIDAYGAYLRGENDTLPEVDANAFADILQTEIAAEMEKETGVTFAEADRAAILVNTKEDLTDWNTDLQEAIGTGFGKFTARFLCGLSGIITFGGLTVGFFLLWLIFAVKGHWRKGRMLTGFGCAVAIPSLVVLAGNGLLLLLVRVLDVIPALSFAAEGLPTLLLPMVWGSLSLALCGMIFASVGICTNAVVKVKQKKDASAPKAETMSIPAPEAPLVSEQQEADTAPVLESQSSFCPYCGAQNELESKFCGSCGKPM